MFLGNLLDQVTEGGLGYLHGRQAKEERDRQRQLEEEERAQQAQFDALRMALLQAQTTGEEAGTGLTRARTEELMRPEPPDPWEVAGLPPEIAGVAGELPADVLMEMLRRARPGVFPQAKPAKPSVAEMDRNALIRYYRSPEGGGMSKAEAEARASGYREPGDKMDWRTEAAYKELLEIEKAELDVDPQYADLAAPALEERRQRWHERWGMTPDELYAKLRGESVSGLDDEERGLLEILMEIYRRDPEGFGAVTGGG